MEVEMNLEIGEVQSMADVMFTVTDTIAQKRTLNKVVFAVAAEGRQQFGMQVDAAARTGGDADGTDGTAALHHVYESDSVGTIAGRLFKVTVTRPSSGSTVIRTNFLPSKRPVPERDYVGETIPVVVIKDGRKSVRNMQVWPNAKQHIFTHKASVMEFGQKVTIKPKGDNMLFWIDPHEKRGHLRDVPSVVDHSGRNYTGAYTAMWTNFWNNMVEQLVVKPMENDLTPILQNAVNKAMASTAKKAARSAQPTGPVRAGSRVTNNGAPQSGPFKAKRQPGTANKLENDISRVTNKYG